MDNDIYEGVDSMVAIQNEAHEEIGGASIDNANNM